MSGERRERAAAHTPEAPVAAGRGACGPLQRVARHSGWGLAAQIATAGFALAQAVLLARGLGPEGYGIYVLVGAFVLGVSQLLDSRLFETITRFVPQLRERGEPRKAEAVMRLCLGVELAAGAAAAAIVLLLAEPAARLLLKDAAGAAWIRLFALAPVLLVPQEPCAALLRVADRFGWLAWQRAGTALLATVALAVALAGGGGIAAVLLAQLFALAAGSLVLAAMALRTCRSLGLHPLRTPSRALGAQRRRIVRFALHSNWNATSRMVSQRADLFVLGIFAAPAAVALYELARRIVLQAQALAVPLYAAVFPEMARLAARGEWSALRRLRVGLTRAAVLVVLPGCAALGWLAPSLLSPVFGPAFGEAAPLLQVMAWQLAWLPLVWFPAWLLSLGRARTLALTSSADALLALCLLLALVPAFGAAGAAWAGLLRTFAWIAIALRVVQGIERDDARQRQGAEEVCA